MDDNSRDDSEAPSPPLPLYTPQNILHGSGSSCSSTTVSTIQRLSQLRVSRTVLTALLISIDILWPFALYTLLPALPAMTESLHTIPQWAQFTILWYIIIVVICQPLGMYLANTYGRRPITILGLLIFSATGFGCYFSPNILVLNLCRIFQGLGAGLFSISKDLTVLDVFHAKDNRIKGVLNGSTPITMIFSVIIGGIFVFYFHWRDIFLFTSLLSSFAMLFAYFKLPETRILSIDMAPTLDLDVIDPFWESYTNNTPGEENINGQQSSKKVMIITENTNGNITTSDTSRKRRRRRRGHLPLWRMKTVFKDYIFVIFYICCALFHVIFWLFICEWPFIATDIYSINAIDVGLILALVIFSQIFGSILFGFWSLFSRRRIQNTSNSPTITPIDSIEDDDRTPLTTPYDDGIAYVSLEKVQIMVDRHHARIIQIAALFVLLGAVFAIFSPLFGDRSYARRSNVENNIHLSKSGVVDGQSWQIISQFYNGSLWFLSVIIPMIFIQISRGLCVISLNTISDEPYPTKKLKVDVIAKLFVMAFPALIVLLFTQLTQGTAVPLMSTAFFSISAGIVGILIFVSIFFVSNEAILQRMKMSRAMKAMMSRGYEDENSVSFMAQNVYGVKGMGFMNITEGYEYNSPVVGARNTNYQTFQG